MSPPSLVLIVDDQPDSRRALEEILDHQGYQLEFVEAGSEALDVAARLAPDLILLDEQLADIDGVQVVRQLRGHAKLADVPIVLMMTRVDRDARLRGLQSGADDLISRPLDRAEVRARVRSITRLNRYRHLQEAARYKADLETAAAVQRFLLPACPPDVPGLDICAGAEYCDQLGGDTYDFVRLPNGRLMVTIGDVAGHGVGPALLMAATQALVRREAVEVGEHPEKVLQRLNHYLAQTLEGVRFITMTILVWEAATKTIEWASAGHEPLVYYDASLGTCRSFRASNVPLGVDVEWKFVRGETLTVKPGDIAFLCTDGLVESTNEQGEMFGRERLAELLCAHAQESACEICRQLREALTSFCGGRPPLDDVTLCLLKSVTPEGTDTAP